MNKSKLLKILVIGLVILNIGTITALVIGRPNKPNEPKNVIINRLGFDQAQIVQYEALIADHKEILFKKNGIIRSNKNLLFQLLQQNDHSKKDSIINTIGTTQEDLEQINFQHFNDIKSICKPDQLPKFNELTSDMAHFFNKNKNRK